MISIDIPKNKIDRFLKNLKTNIHAESGQIGYDVTKEAKTQAKRLAPFYKGHLRNSISRLYNRKTQSGRVFIVGDAAIQNAAMLNELGPRAGSYPNGIITPGMLPVDGLAASKKLKSWMKDKNKTKMRLGGANTSWGKKNKFMSPAIHATTLKVPGIIVRGIERAITKSLI